MAADPNRRKFLELNERIKIRREDMERIKREIDQAKSERDALKPLVFGTTYEGTESTN